MCCCTPLTSLLVLGKVHMDFPAVDLVAIQIALRAGRRRYVKVLAEAESLRPAGLPVRDDPAESSARIVASACLLEMMMRPICIMLVRTGRINKS